MGNRLSKSRSVFIAIFLGSFLLLAFGYYLQWAENILPCALCYVQRTIFFIIMILALVAALHNPTTKWRGGYWLSLILWSLVGIGVAAWQLWVQIQNNAQTACLPNIGPLGEWLSNYGDCGEITWQFVGVSIPGWSLLCFLLIAITAIWRFSTED